MSDISLKSLFLELLPDDGSFVGNLTLRPKFIQEAKQTLSRDLQPEDYRRVKVGLLDEGKVVLGRGKGGSVGKNVDLPVSEEYEDQAKMTEKESALYPPFHTTIETEYTKDYRIKHAVCAVTAAQGKKPTGGDWTRPDITLVAVHKFLLIPGTIVDVTTFEIKPLNDFNIKGVFETAAHTAFAHRSYLAIHVTKNPPDSAAFDRVKEECRRFGVGLLTFNDAGSYDTFDILIEPDFRTPDWRKVHDFLHMQFPLPKREALQELIHG